MGKHKFDKSFNKEYFIDRVIFFVFIPNNYDIICESSQLRKIDNIAKTLRVQQHPLVLVNIKLYLLKLVTNSYSFYTL